MAEKKHKGMLEVEPQKSSAAQFLTYIASTGAGGEKYEIRYEDENIWMSQKMLAAVYGVEIPNIAYHLRKLFADTELDKVSVIKKILITAPDGFWSRGVPEKCVEEVTAALAKAHAEAEFEKYRIVQDRLFLSDYDRYLLALEEELKQRKSNGGVK